MTRAQPAPDPPPAAPLGDLREAVTAMIDARAFNHPGVHPQHMKNRRREAIAKAEAIITLVADRCLSSGRPDAPVYAANLHTRLLAVESGAQCGPGVTDFGGVTGWHRNPDGPEASGRIGYLECQVRFLKLALTPFARIAAEYDAPQDSGAPPPDHATVGCKIVSPAASDLNVGHFRKARGVLNQWNEPPSETTPHG